MLSADFLHLEEDVDFVNQYADVFHLDIMDGVSTGKRPYQEFFLLFLSGKV